MGHCDTLFISSNSNCLRFKNCFFQFELDPNKKRFEGTGNDVKLKKIETEKNALFVTSNYSAATTTDIIYVNKELELLKVNKFSYSVQSSF